MYSLNKTTYSLTTIQVKSRGRTQQPHNLNIQAHRCIQKGCIPHLNNNNSAVSKLHFKQKIHPYIILCINFHESFIIEDQLHHFYMICYLSWIFCDKVQNSSLILLQKQICVSKMIFGIEILLCDVHNFCYLLQHNEDLSSIQITILYHCFLLHDAISIVCPIENRNY